MLICGVAVEWLQHGHELAMVLLWRCSAYALVLQWFCSTGVATSISPNLLAGIEERDELIPYATLCLVASAFDCDPIDLVKDETKNHRPRETDIQDGEPILTYDERFRLD